MDCCALESNHSSPASMTLNPFSPTFRPQQRPKPHSISQPQPLGSVDSSEPSVSQAKIAKASIANSRSPQVEEQIHLLSAQLKELKTYSESSVRQSTRLLHKFPLVHLK